MSRSATFRDVARAAKVSPATVSRVARDNPSVALEIQNRVKIAAARLGVDLGERRGESGKMLAFVLANRDVLHEFHARILVGAEKYCSRMNCELIFLSFNYSPGIALKDLHLPQIFQRRMIVRAAILAGMNYPNLLAALREHGIPCAILGNNVVGDWQPGEYDVVYSNDMAGALDLTRHLVAQGHRDIWFIGDCELPWFARCADGYRAAMREADLALRMSEIHSDGRELGYLATKSILGRHEPVSAIFAGSDQVAKGVYEALEESGIPIPQGISVAGCNDTQGSLLQPPLSSVREFPEELGRHLADFALRRIEDPALPPQFLTIPTQVVLRSSVQAPNLAARRVET